MILPTYQTKTPTDEAIEAALRESGPGAFALAALATAIVVAIWFAFYLFVFMPRTSAP